MVCAPLVLCEKKKVYVPFSLAMIGEAIPETDECQQRSWTALPRGPRDRKTWFSLELLGKDQKGIYKRGIHDQGDFWKFLLEIAVQNALNRGNLTYSWIPLLWIPLLVLPEEISLRNCCIKCPKIGEIWPIRGYPFCGYPFWSCPNFREP